MATTAGAAAAQPTDQPPWRRRTARRPGVAHDRQTPMVSHPPIDTPQGCRFRPEIRTRGRRQVMAITPRADVAALVDAARRRVARHETVRTPSPARLDELVHLLEGLAPEPGEVGRVRALAEELRQRTAELEAALAAPPPPPASGPAPPSGR